MVSLIKNIKQLVGTHRHDHLLRGKELADLPVLSDDGMPEPQQSHAAALAATLGDYNAACGTGRFSPIRML